MGSPDVMFYVRFKPSACTRIALIACSEGSFNPQERGHSLATMLAECLDATTWRALVERTLELSQPPQPSTPPDGRPQGRF